MDKGASKALASVLAQEAKAAGLRYTSDADPGISRRSKMGKFGYFHRDGTRVSDAETLHRINRLAIPPAWTDVWISPHPNGHIQATGRDARGRKQYRYHEDWQQHRDENKFDHMIAFARALPRIRRRVRRDISRRGMPREKVLATVVRLLETTLIRVGNDEYARHNKSYGLTTMRNKHARVVGGTVQFKFRGKSAKQHEISIFDPKLSRIVRRCQDMPGQELFAYNDEDGCVRDVGSQDVNCYLREVSGADFTAKDFRTWAGTVLAAIALREFEAAVRPAKAKKNIITAIEAVARMLGNTPSVCRKCYIHPTILDAYLAGTTISTIHQRLVRKMDQSLSRLTSEEAAVVVLIEHGLQKKAARPRRGKPRSRRIKS